MFRDGICQSLGFDPLFAEQSGLVAVSAVAEDCHNVLAGSQLLGHLHRSNNVQGRGRADIDTFLIQQSVNHLQRICIWNLDCIVNQLNISLQVVRNTSLTDT